MQLFNFDNNEVRVVHLGDPKEPWWAATDVCRCLGLPTGNGATMHLRKLEDSEKTLVFRRTPNQIWGVAELFRGVAGRLSHKLTLINESGLYKLIMRSDKLEARRFQTWITCEVLPALRRDGYYVTEEVRREHPEAVRQFEQSILSKADPEEVSTLEEWRQAPKVQSTIPELRRAA